MDYEQLLPLTPSIYNKELFLEKEVDYWEEFTLNRLKKNPNDRRPILLCHPMEAPMLLHHPEYRPVSIGRNLGTVLKRMKSPILSTLPIDTTRLVVITKVKEMEF